MLIRKILSLLIVALMVPLTGCATRGGPVSYDTAAFTTPDAVRPDLTGSGTIGKLDVLAVNVYQLPELNRDYQVDTDGNIVMPLVGSVKADGLSATDLARDISARLAARYVRSPSVTVGIKQTAVQTVTVEGAVNRPGMFPIPGQDLVAARGGTRRRAKPGRQYQAGGDLPPDRRQACCGGV